jgi:hypothetical protein
MSQYELCPQCKRVPVNEPGETCDECRERQREIDRMIDRKYDRIYGKQLAQTQPLRKGQRNHGRDE